MMTSCTSPKRTICMDLPVDVCAAVHIESDEQCAREGMDKQECDARHAQNVRSANENPEVRQIYEALAAARKEGKLK